MKNINPLVTTMLCIGLSTAPALAQNEILTPYLTSADNFRDVAGISALYGGTGFANDTAFGGVMRTGVFYRSTNLNGLNPTDLETISNLGITRVIDLRTPSEVAANPDITPIGAVEVYHNIYTTYYPITPPVTSIAAVETYTHQAYQGFVTDPAQRAVLKDILLDLASTQGAELYHCSAGKDRTGWVSMMLESIAGVSPSKIMQDYLATNLYTASTINATLAQVYADAGGGAAGDAAVAILRPLLSVQPDFLQAGLDQVIATYGSMYNYLTQGLGLTQADLYVLRAKMVYYQTLPGQTLLSGNAASGAAFLNSLQNSPLSGHYTAYNYYLQSAIDAGTLGGVESRVGGQIHADSVAYLTQLDQVVDDTITPHASGQNLRPGATDVWMSGVAGYQDVSSRSGITSSDNRNSGIIIGGTHRFTDKTSAYLGTSFITTKVEDTGASSDSDNFLALFGGRYAFSGLEAGLYLDARVIAGTVNYNSTRALDYGLGTASGKTDGEIYSGRFDVGNIFDFGSFTLTPEVGVRVTNATLNSFNEEGSELALNVNGISQTTPSVLTDVRIDLKERKLGSWSLKPTATVGYERALDSSKVTSTGTLYGYSVSQESAYDSQNMAKFGVGLTAQQGALGLELGVTAMAGENTEGITRANFNLVYSF